VPFEPLARGYGELDRSSLDLLCAMQPLQQGQGALLERHSILARGEPGQHERTVVGPGLDAVSLGNVEAFKPEVDLGEPIHWMRTGADDTDPRRPAARDLELNLVHSGMECEALHGFELVLAALPVHTEAHGSGREIDDLERAVVRRHEREIAQG